MYEIRTSILNFMSNESNNKNIYRNITKSIPGVFYKELEKLSRSKYTGFSTKIAFPENSEVPLIEIVIDDEKKLTPIMWSKELPE